VSTLDDLLGKAKLAPEDADWFWSITEPFGWGTKTTDNDAIEAALMRTLSADEADRLSGVFGKLKYALDKLLGKRTDIDVGGDDSWDDFLSHIVGLGRAEYEAVLADPMLAVERGNKGKYTESFAYCLPCAADYERAKPGWYIKWATRGEGAFRTILGASDDDIPWLPKIRPDLEALADAFGAYATSEDWKPLLARDADLRAAAERVELTLRKLSGNFENEALSDAVHTAQNKYLTWNILTDMRKFLINAQPAQEGAPAP
jgi:hypothetical protein